MRPDEHDSTLNRFLEALQMMAEAPKKPAEETKPKPSALPLSELLTEKREPSPENLTELISLFMQYRVSLIHVLTKMDKLFQAYRQLVSKLDMLYESREETDLTTMTAYYVDYIVNTEINNLKRFFEQELTETDLEWVQKIESLDLPAHVQDQLNRTARQYIQEAIVRAVPNHRFFG